MIHWGKLLMCILACQVVGVAGAFITAPAISDWYVSLNKPTLTPPGYLFGPIWTVLYFLMGVAVYLIWDKVKPGTIKRKAIALFVIQLALNFLWSMVFFGLQQIGLAVVVIIFLWIAIFLVIRQFRKLDKWSAYLLYPYLAWVSFASLLNLSFWWINH